MAIGEFSRPDTTATKETLDKRLQELREDYTRLYSDLQSDTQILRLEENTESGFLYWTGEKVTTKFPKLSDLELNEDFRGTLTVQYLDIPDETVEQLLEEIQAQTEYVQNTEQIGSEQLADGAVTAEKIDPNLAISAEHVEGYGFPFIFVLVPDVPLSFKSNKNATHLYVEVTTYYSESVGERQGGTIILENEDKNETVDITNNVFCSTKNGDKSFIKIYNIPLQEETQYSIVLKTVDGEENVVVYNRAKMYQTLCVRPNENAGGAQE